MVILSLGGVNENCFLHGLGQTAQDWKEVVQQLSISDVDCPELFSSAEDEISYSQILGDLEQRYSEVKEPLRICGLSLGALLAIDFAIRHEEKSGFAGFDWRTI